MCVRVLLATMLVTWGGLRVHAEGDDQAAPKQVSRSFAFDEEAELEDVDRSATGEAVKRKGGPKVEDGKLVLLESWWRSTAVAAFPAVSDERFRVVEARWTLTMNTGTDGAGFLWLDTVAYGGQGAAPALAAWEAPSQARSFGLGFDALNPPNRDPFRGSGNVYDRPQHELSLHFDGKEIVKRTTPEDFRDEKPHVVVLRIEFVVGGAEVSVSIDDAAVYDRYFIPGMTTYVGRAVFGAHNGETAGDVLIDDFSVTCREPTPRPPSPVSVTAIDRAINDKDHHKNAAWISFPDETDRFGRIICTLRLDEPEGGFDPWDRAAAVYVYGDDGERFELIRYITPYDRGYEWHVDVTDFRPLLSGRRKIEQACATYASGWLVTVRFDFHPGKVDRLAYRLVNLWSGSPEIGNPDKPVEAFYTPKSLELDSQTSSAKFRMVVTGHGMLPNTDNAGEFMPLERTLTVNGKPFTNRLWKEDNYLNPCRPQGGTWKYDRAGWAPGDVVTPWEIDLTEFVQAGGKLELSYRLEDYVNEARGQTWAPTHQTEAIVVFYRKP